MMTQEHSYRVQAESVRPMFIGVRVKDMDEFEVTSAPDWWPDAPPGYFSPQTMFVSASASCYALSLFRAAKALRTKFKHVFVDAFAPMMEEDGIWRFEAIQLKVRIVLEEEADRAKMDKAALMAHNSCPINNSLRTSSTLDYELVVE